MWCRRVQNQLSALADGELTRAEAAAVQQHLTQCEACSREYSEIRRWVTLAAGLPEEELSTGFHDRLMARIATVIPNIVPETERSTASQRRALFNPWMWAGCTTAAAALALGVIQVRSEEKATVPQPQHPSVQTPSISQPVPPVLTERKDRTENPQICRDPGLPVMVAPAPKPAAEPPSVETVRRLNPPASDSDKPATRKPAETLRTPAQPILPQSPTPRAAPVPPRELLPHDTEVGGTTPGKPAGDLRGNDAGTVMAQMPSTGISVGMDVLREATGVPVVNSVVTAPQPETSPSPSEKTPSTRMAGTGLEPETHAVGQEDEGLLQFRSYLQENNSTVPQPPINSRNRLDRRPRKL